MNMTLIPFRWEPIDFEGYGITERARVFGGWLIRTYVPALISENYSAISIIFIKDANHLWSVR